MNHDNSNLRRVAFFDELADQIERDEMPPEEKVRSFIARLNIKTGDTVLDIGTGTGFLIPFLFEHNPGNVLAIDFSAKMLQKLSAKYTARYETKLLPLCCDVHRWNLEDRSADVAVCNGVYPHFYDQKLALSQIFRVLKPGGTIAINHFQSKEFINSIHAGMDEELIRQDLLKPVAQVAKDAEEVGFIVDTTIDNASEYCLIARKS